MPDIDAVRRGEFPWAAGNAAIYLNNASTGPLPARTVRASADFTALRAEPFRLSDALQMETLARSRELVARMIGADPSEIALATNTGYGLNLAAAALPLDRGDVVLAPDLEFPANVYPWMALQERRGVAYRQLPCRDGLLDEELLLETIAGDPDVRAVALSWVGFATGYVANLERIGSACRARGIYFVVDAIQGLGALPLDVRACHIDVLSCGAQKWLLSPWGTGFVYIRRELAEALEPPVVSWFGVRGSDDFARLLDYELSWREDARRFELLTLPFQDFAGMNASLELLLDVGLDAVAERVRALTGRIVKWAEGREDVKLITPVDADRRAGIVSLVPPGPAATAAKLNEARVSFSLREGAIRLSPHFYNTEDEIDAALEAIERQ